MTPVAITPPPSVPAGYHLKFWDDFNTLDLSRDRQGNHSWYEGIWFNAPNPEANIEQEGSLVRITYEPGQAVPETDISSLLDFNYGYIEAMIRWDVVAPGAWPAVWLLPKNGPQILAAAQAGSATAVAAEFDIMEAQPDLPKVICSSIHGWSGPSLQTDIPGQPNTWQAPASFFGGSWHRYGMLWTPGKAQFFVDDQPTIAASIPASIDSESCYIVLSMCCGQGWEHNIPPENQEKMSLEVDWVRVWQQS